MYIQQRGRTDETGACLVACLSVARLTAHPKRKTCNIRRGGRADTRCCNPGSVAQKTAGTPNCCSSCPHKESMRRASRMGGGRAKTVKIINGVQKALPRAAATLSQASVSMLC